MIIIIDYNMGNLRSVLKSFDRIDITLEPDEALKADKLLLPGVGLCAKSHGYFKIYGA